MDDPVGRGEGTSPLTALIDALERHFEDEGLSRAVVARSGMSGRRIRFEEPAYVRWPAIVLEAIRQRKLDALVTRAMRDAEAPELGVLLADYRASAVAHGLPPQVPPWALLASAAAAVVAGLAGVLLFSRCGTRPALYSISIALLALAGAALVFILLQSRVSRRWQWIAAGACLLLVAGGHFLAGECTYGITAHVTDERGRPLAHGSLQLAVDPLPPKAEITPGGEATLHRIPARFRDPENKARIVADIEGYRLEKPDALWTLHESPITIRARRMQISSLRETGGPGWPDTAVQEIAALGAEPSETQTRHLIAEYERGLKWVREMLSTPNEPTDADHTMTLIGVLRVMYHIQKKTSDRPEWAEVTEDAEAFMPGIMDEVRQ